MHGDAAIVLTRYVQRGSIDGASRDSAFRMTDVWVRAARGWTLAARHAQPLGP